jgi:uncharacterized protein (TIGR02246 family)
MTANDEQQIRELVATWFAATKAGDVAKVLTLMTDDAVFLVAGQPPFGTEKFAETMKGPLGKPRAQIDGSSDIQEIHVSGDLAYAWSKLRVDVTPPGGEPIRRAGHTLTVFRKTAGRWQLARDANLLTPVEN